MLFVALGRNIRPRFFVNFIIGEFIMNSERIKTQLRNEFKHELTVRGLDLRKGLSEIDVLDNACCNNLLALFGKDLAILMSGYAVRIGVDAGDLPDCKIDGTSYAHCLSKVAGGVGGAATGAAASVVTVATKTTGILFWKKVVDVSLAASIATATGASLVFVTGGISVVGAALGWALFSKNRKNHNKKEKIDGALSSNLDACQIPYQVVCEKMGFYCFGTKEQFHVLTDKTAFIETCKKNGVDVIPQYEEKDFDVDDKAIEYPIFVKPCDSRGSRGQTVCYTYEEVKSAIAFAKSESRLGKVIIEKYMRGKQDFSVSYFVINGEPTLVRTVDRYLGAKEDHMDKSAIIGLSPSKCTDFFLKTENEKIKKMIKAIGIQNGPVFLQGFVDDTTVRYYDPGLRLPGSGYDRMYEKATGVNFGERLIEFALTGKITNTSLPEDASLGGKYMVNLFVVLKPGKIKNIFGVDTIAASPKVVSYMQKYFSGDEVGAFYNVNQRFGEFNLVCDSKEETAETIDWVYRTLRIENEAGEDMKMSVFDTALLMKD